MAQLAKLNSSRKEKRVIMWQRSLNALECGLSKILKRETSELSLGELSRMAFDIARAKKCRELYEKVRQLIFTHIQSIRPNLHQTLDEDQLHTLIRSWSDHLVSARMFRDVLMFLEQSYVITENIQDIYNMSIIIYRNEIIRHDGIRERVQNILLEMVHAERKGESIDNSVFKATINMLLSLSAVEGNNIEYEQIFEEKFLLHSAEFYEQEAQNLSTVDIKTYIKSYKTRLNEEKERVTKFLHQQTEKKIIIVLDKCLMNDQLNKILEHKNEVRHFLDTACYEELSIIYEWFKKFDKQNDFIKMITEIFCEFGTSIIDVKEDIRRDSDQAKVVKSLIELKEKFNIYQRCFQTNQTYLKDIEKKFQEIFNHNPTRIAESLSAYIHEAMKNARDDLFSQKQLNGQLDALITLIRIFLDKDLFLRFYRNHFAKRLIIKPNLVVEKMMLTKLKIECGASYTRDLELMMKDFDISSTHMDKFNAAHMESLNGIGFSMTVLNSKAWRFKNFQTCNLAPGPRALFELYSKFYADNQKPKKVHLHLQPNFGTAMIKANYERNQIENFERRSTFYFDVSTLQMIILLLFNDHECLTCQEIQHLTKIPESNLISSLSPLVLGKSKFRMLKRVDEFPPKSPLTMDTKIAVNENYYSKVLKIKIPSNTNQIDAVSNREDIKVQTEFQCSSEIDQAIARVVKKYGMSAPPANGL